MTLTKRINESRGEKSDSFTLTEQNEKFRELRSFLDDEIKLGEFDEEEGQAARGAMETFDYKYLAMQIDSLIDNTNWRIDEMPKDKQLEQNIKSEARGRDNANTDMMPYLQYKLKKLREYRQLLYEKSYLGEK